MVKTFTQEQIAALKYLIAGSKDGDDLAKQIMWYLIEASNYLSDEVCLTLLEDREGYTSAEIDQAVNGWSRMNSSNCGTHLSQMFTAMGSDFHFDCHYGDYDPERGDEVLNCAGIFAGWPVHKVQHPNLVLEGQPLRYTFWLCNAYYSRNARLVTTSRDQLEQINLRKPGLYPDLESQRHW